MKKKRRPVTINAILKAEGRGERLNATEVKKLLRHELSLICRYRDNYTCFISGARVLPGIGPGTGQAAHAIPINQLPPEYRYDPRVVFWMEGSVHSDFDGRTRFGHKPANQAIFWGKLQRTDPERFAWLTSIPRNASPRTVPLSELIEQLQSLRAMRRAIEPKENT